MFKFKKIASVLASALMIGSTVGLAAAANYPAPFVTGGSPDVAIVFGSHPMAVADLVAVTRISDNLNSQITTTTTTTNTTVSGGDSVLIAKASDRVNLANTASTVFGTTVDDDDLTTLLKDGIYTNDENTEYDYEQKITLGAWKLEHFKDSDFNNNEPSVGFNLSSSHSVLNYTINFLDQPESDIVSSELADFETTTLRMLGRDYFVLDADNTSNIKLTLLDSATTGFIAEGETVTVTSGGKSYDVTINFISTTEVILNVNGQNTNSLAEGATYKLSDGTYVGIKDILARDVSGVVSKVEFSLGSGKLELTSGSNIKLNDKSINQVKAKIVRGSATRDSLSKIDLEWITDDREFIAEGSELVLPGFGAIKISMPNFVVPDPEVTEVRDSGGYTIELKTVLKDGSITVPLLYANESGEFQGIGKDSSNLLVTSPEITSVIFNYTAGDRYMVASWNGSLRDPESYILKFVSFTTDNGVPKVNIEKMTEGNEWTSVCNTKKTDDTCDIGSLTLTLNNVTDSPVEYANVSGNAGSNFHTLYTKSGLKIYMPFSNKSYYGATYAPTRKGVLSAGTHWRNGLPRTGISFDTNGSNSYEEFRGGQSFRLQFTEPNKDGDINAGGNFNITLDDQSTTDPDVEVSSITSNQATAPMAEVEDSNNLQSRVYSDLATMIRRIGSSSAQRDAEITFSGGEAYAEIYLIDETATIGGGGGGTGGTVGVPLLDTEVSSAAGKNIVVVGGSCVNTVAASLLASSAPICGADFTTKTGVSANQFLIETFTRTGDKVATLVAGYNAGDTTNAATYFTTQTIMTDVGKKYIGTSATAASLQATATA